MANYNLSWMNDQARNNPAGFVEACEAHYQEQINRVAEQIAAKQAERPIALLWPRPPAERRQRRTGCTARWASWAFMLKRFPWMIIISAAANMRCRGP